MALIIVHLHIINLHLPNSTIFQCIFKIFQLIVGFSKMVFFSLLKYPANSNLKISKCPDLSKILHPIRPHKVTIKVVYKNITLFQFQLIILYLLIKHIYTTGKKSVHSSVKNVILTQQFQSHVQRCFLPILFQDWTNQGKVSWFSATLVNLPIFKLQL